MLLKKKGQSTLEYGIFIAIVVAALLSIQIYMKRGMQGRLRTATDDIGEQFEAKKTSYTYTTTRTGKVVEHVDQGVTMTFAGEGPADKDIGEAEKVGKTGTETVKQW